jgi:hypothetical protein
VVEEMTLLQVIERLQVLENQVETIRTNLYSEPSQADFEFVVRVDGREVWSGSDVEAHYLEIRRQHPNAEVSIGWRAPSAVLI